MATQAEHDLMVKWARALSIMTAEEIRASADWSDPSVRAAIDILDAEAGGYEGRLATHNPLYYLAERVYFDNVLDDPNFLYPPLHRDKFCKALLDYYLEPYDSDTCGFLLLMPRLTYKSTFMHGVLVLFLALREKFLHGRDSRILMVHHKEDQASRNLVLLKEKCQHNKWLREMWPEASINPTYDTQTYFDWNFRVPGVYHERSVSAIGLGGRSTGDHYDFIIYDDIVTKEHTKSRVVREKCADDYAASRFLLDTVRAKEFDCGTRYHPQDQWQRLIDANVEGRKLYRTLVIQGQDDKTDELAHPFRLSEKKMEQIRQECISRDGNDVLYHLQIQNSVQSSGLTATEMAWLRYIHEYEVPSGWTCILCDPAWKGTKNAGEGCYAAIGVIRFVRIGVIVYRYLMDLVVSNEMTSLDGQREIYRLMRKWGVVDVGVEENGGYTFHTQLEYDAGSQGLIINMIEFESKQTAKPERIATFMKHVQGGHFFITKECPNQEEFEREFRDWPLVHPVDVLDMLGYSADPAITENYAPRTPSMVESILKGAPPRHYVSRYCLR